MIQSMNSTELFYIVGKVDGISFQLDASSEDAREWHEIKVVVEVKNRIGRIPLEPPLYDQIQLVTYMLMLGCPFGDLVQAMTCNSQYGNRNRRNDNSNNNSNNNNNNKRYNQKKIQ